MSSILTHRHTEILVVCALYKEADAVRKVFGCDFRLGELGGRPYWLFQVEGVNVMVAWAGRAGAQHTTTLISNLLPHVDAHLQALLMCGICAGVREDTEVGDVVIGTKVFDYATGAKIRPRQALYDVDAFSPNDHLLMWLSSQVDNSAWMERILLQKPPTRRFIRDVVLSSLAASQTADQIRLILGMSNLDDSGQEITMFGIQQVLKQLKEEGLIEKTRLSLTQEGQSRVQESHTIAISEMTSYPKKDRFRPRLIPGSIASGPFVRQDMPEHIIELRTHAGQRKTVALDMEAISIYQATTNHNFAKCAIKAVSDYGDLEKEDSFHDYSAQAAAAFVLHMIRSYFSPRLTRARQEVTKCPKMFKSDDDPDFMKILQDRLAISNTKIIFVSLGLSLLGAHGYNYLSIIKHRMESCPALQVKILLGHPDNPALQCFVKEELQVQPGGYVHEWPDKFFKFISAEMARFPQAVVERLDFFPMATIVQADQTYFFRPYGPPSVGGSKNPWLMLELDSRPEYYLDYCQRFIAHAESHCMTQKSPLTTPSLNLKSSL